MGLEGLVRSMASNREKLPGETVDLRELPRRRESLKEVIVEKLSTRSLEEITWRKVVWVFWRAIAQLIAESVSVVFLV